MLGDDDENERLRAAALKNADSIVRARQRAERELRSSKEVLEKSSLELDEQRARLEVTLASIGDAVIATDADCRITLLNPIAESLIGVSASEAIGRPLEEVFRTVDTASGKSLENPIRQVLASGEPMELVSETALVQQHGGQLAIEDSAAPIRDPLGRLTGAIMVFRDVSDRRLAERELRAREERFRAVFDQAAVGIAMADLDGRFVEVNDKFADILGYDVDEIVSLGYADITHPDDVDATRSNVRQLLAGEIASYTMEKRYLRKDGTVVWSHTTVTGLRNAAGQLEQMLGVIEDITARVEAQETLRQEARVLELLNATGAAIVSRLDLREVLQTATDAATQLSGAQFGALFHNVIDDQRETYALYTLSGAPREAFDKFGLPRATPVFKPTFHGEGVVRSPDISQDPRYGQVAPHYGIPEGHLPVRSYLAAPVVSPTGEVIGGMFVGHPEPNVFGERAERLVVGVAAQAAIAIDNARLFENAQAELAQRERAENALREADRKKDEFLATLAHELRNPLAPIRQAVTIARSESANREQRSWSHDVIDRQVRNMALLLDDLLDISRITRGVLPLRVEMVDLATVVNEAVETARPLIERMHHDLSVDLPPEPLSFAADPLRISQVLSNLLTNAAKYTPAQGSISLSAEYTDEQLVIRVSDTGIGIPAESIDEVFTMFSQVKSSSELAAGGLGIGLSLSQAIVQSHGGAIEAKSAGYGKGSEFVVRLPLREIDVPAPEPMAQAGGDPGGCRVLIADDNRDAADSLAMLLRMSGHEPTVVYDGRAALAACKATRPAVALLDIGMPGLDGYEVARRVRKSTNGSDMVLAAVTGWGQEADKARAFDAGFDHHFTKPISMEQIGQLLRSAGPGS